MEICFHRNIKSVIIIINFDAAILSHFFPVSFGFFFLNNSFTLLEFEIAVAVFCLSPWRAQPR